MVRTWLLAVMAGCPVWLGGEPRVQGVDVGATWRGEVRRAAPPDGVDGGGRRKRPRKDVGAVNGGRDDPEGNSGE